MKYIFKGCGKNYGIPKYKMSSKIDILKLCKSCNKNVNNKGKSITKPTAAPSSAITLFVPISTLTGGSCRSLAARLPRGVIAPLIKFEPAERIKSPNSCFKHVLIPLFQVFLSATTNQLKAIKPRNRAGCCIKAAIKV